MRGNSFASPPLRGLRRLLIPSPKRSLLPVFLAACTGLLVALFTEGPEVAPAASPEARPVTPFPAATASATLLEQRLEAMVLTLDDVLPLSGSFEVDRDRTGPLDNAAAAALWPDAEAALKRYERWGRSAGYRRTFWRPRLITENAAPLEVQSSVWLYRTEQGAADALSYPSGELLGPDATAITIAPIGAAARAYRLDNGPFTLYLVEFSKGNGVTSLLVTTFSEQASREVAAGLARTMAGRMR